MVKPKSKAKIKVKYQAEGTACKSCSCTDLRQVITGTIKGFGDSRMPVRWRLYCNRCDAYCGSMNFGNFEWEVIEAKEVQDENNR